MSRTRSAMTAAVLLAGCSSGSEPTVRSQVRDSVGVTIVDNPAPAPESRISWEIGAEPILTIGTLDGDEAYQLFNVRTATKLADGRFLVANGGTSEIRVFDASGTYVDSWGQEGEGPGEFTSLRHVVAWTGDSVMAWDSRQRRFSIFDLQGSHGRTVAPELGEDFGPVRYQGLLSDGSMLVMGQTLFEPGASGIVRPDQAYARIGPAGETLGSLGQHPGPETFLRSGEDFVFALSHPFARSTSSAIWGDRVLISPNDTYEIRGYDERGALEIIVRREYELREVSQADVDARVAEQLAAVGGDVPPQLMAMFGDFPTVEHFPSFSRLVVDGSGYLWVEEFAMPGDELSIWTVFDLDGRMEGFVEMPTGLEVYEIGGDYILGRATDDLGVEYVQMWSLTRFIG